MNAWLFPFCNCGLKTTLRLFGNYKVEGRENIPARGPVLFVANHLANLDPAVVGAACGRSPRFMAKKELFRYRFFAFLLTAYGAHPIDRTGVDRDAMKWALKQLKEPDGALVLFPEGTRDRKKAGMRQGLGGVTQLALMSGAPIIPMGLTGTEPLQRPWRAVVPAARVRVKVGPLFRIDNESGKRPSKDDLRAITDEIMVRVARLVPEPYRGYYRDKVDMPLTHTVEVAAAAPATAGATA